ncbi:hypothetical protein GCK32_017431 [Trichostrongylus colubriformis]|uniref:Uncharacterized protein n=1 Tax=Trichostrongylus colubriformis TaxID=6319 RepID=A0AAN8J147_TRICO
MASCAYLCSGSTANLLMAREKLPSIRSSMTMPKMELTAITLAMRLVNALITQVHGVIKIHLIYIFTDSEIVLSWLKRSERREKGVFIKNRLNEIRKIHEHLKSKGYEIHFMFVPSSQNCADCATRGLHKSDLEHHMWWVGPSFLHKSTAELLKLKITSTPCFSGEEENCEEKEENFEIDTISTKSPVPSEDDDLVSERQATTLTKAKRILAYVLRFVRVITLQVQTKCPSRIKISTPLKETMDLSTTILTAKELKMDARDLYADATYLTRLLIKSNPTAEEIETELNKCFNEIHNHIAVSTTVRNHLNFLKDDDPFKKGGAGERLLLMSRFVRSAHQTKETLLRLGTRYILTERIYERQARTGGVSAFRYEDWLAEMGGAHKIGPVNKAVESELRLLMAKIQESEELLGEAEMELRKDEQLKNQYRRLLQQKNEPHDTRKSSGASEKLQRLFQEQVEEIKLLKTRITTLEQQVSTDAKEERNQVERPPSIGQDRAEIADDEYLAQLIKETKDDYEENRERDVPSSSKAGSSSRDRKYRSRQYEEKRYLVECMMMAFEDFPYRRITKFSEGIEPSLRCAFCGALGAHYSDSCPKVREAELRNQVIARHKLCRFCLEDCSNVKCTNRYRRCWYCAKVYRTPFEDLIPDDDGHHRALCPVPDAKSRMKQRLERAIQDLNEWGS